MYPNRRLSAVKSSGNSRFVKNVAKFPMLLDDFFIVINSSAANLQCVGKSLNCSLKAERVVDDNSVVFSKLLSADVLVDEAGIPSENDL